mmetsp:Transcript_29139/g.50956  ORF Transcript_29139/g.50956 Transcript_29139/m.50956 type:complete len:84 (-) Transcript_29139:34-285(-)
MADASKDAPSQEGPGVTKDAKEESVTVAAAGEAEASEKAEKGDVAPPPPPPPPPPPAPRGGGLCTTGIGCDCCRGRKGRRWDY